MSVEKVLQIPFAKAGKAPASHHPVLLTSLNENARTVNSIAVELAFPTRERRASKVIGDRRIADKRTVSFARDQTPLTAKTGAENSNVRHAASGRHKEAASDHEAAAQLHREAASLYEASEPKIAGERSEQALVSSEHAHESSQAANPTSPDTNTEAPLGPFNSPTINN